MPNKALAPSVTHRDPKGRKFIAIVETAYDRAGLTVDEAQRLNETPGLTNLILGFIAKGRRPKGVAPPLRVKKKAKGGKPYLRLLSDRPLLIPAVDGSAVLADATDVFTGYIDPDFRHYKADEPGPATQATPALVYELVQDATFAQMFGSLSPDVAKLCLTQAQIKAFVKKHHNWLRKDGATFFLFQSHSQFFVARVYFYGDGSLRVYAYHFEYDYVWNAESRPRVVAPQLA